MVSIGNIDFRQCETCYCRKFNRRLRIQIIATPPCNSSVEQIIFVANEPEISFHCTSTIGQRCPISFAITEIACIRAVEHEIAGFPFKVLVYRC